MFGKAILKQSTMQTLGYEYVGINAGIFAILKNGFEQFLNKTDMEDLKAEYPTSTIIGELLKKKEL